MQWLGPQTFHIFDVIRYLQAGSAARVQRSWDDVYNLEALNMAAPAFGWDHVSSYEFTHKS